MLEKSFQKVFFLIWQQKQACSGAESQICVCFQMRNILILSPFCFLSNEKKI